MQLSRVMGEGSAVASSHAGRHAIEALEQRLLLTHALGNSFIVSQTRADGNGGMLDVAADADGDFVVVWLSNDEGVRETRGRLYDRSGQPRGDEFRLHHGDRFPRVAMDASGDFVVVTEGVAMLFDSAGTRVSDNLGAGLSPDVAMEDNGDFVIVSHSLESGILARRFSSSATQIGQTIVVEPASGTQTDFVSSPSVAMDANGDFVVVWKQGHQFGDKRIRARRYNNAGAPLGAAFNVTADPVNTFFSDPRVSMDDTGAFAITWPQDGNGTEGEIFVRRYDSAGVSLGNAVQVNNDTDGEQRTADIAMDGDGDFTVSWQDGSDPPVLATARRFSSAGVADGNEMTVDVVAPFGQSDVAIASEDNGTFIVVWKMSLGSQQGIQVFGRRFSPDETSPAAPSRPDLAATSDTGRSNSDNITRDTTPAFIGVTEPGAVVTLLVDGVAVGTDTASGNGLYTIGVPASFNLADGVHSFTVTATDDGPNVSPHSQALSVTIDTRATAAAPNLSANSDTGVTNTDNITADFTPTVGGDAEPNAVIKVFANGVDVSTAFVQLGFIWSMTISALTDGVKNITFTQEDLAGNVSAPSPALPVTIDTLAPAAPAAAPDLDAASDRGASSTDNVTNDDTPLIIGAAPAGTIVRLFAGAADVGLDTSISGGQYGITTADLADGARALAARFEDLAGNQSPAGPALNVLIDTVAPAAPTAAPDLDPASDTGISATDSITRGVALRFNGVAPAGHVVQLFAGDNPIGSGGSSGGQYSVPTAVLGSGDHLITARFEDAAGNASAAGPALSLRVDNLRPQITGSSFSFLSGHSLVFSFNEDVLATVEAKDLLLSNLSTSRKIDPAVMELERTRDAVTFTFPGLPRGILPDGNYRAELGFEGITDVAGNLLDPDRGLEFFVLAGDATRDGKVNLADYFAIDRGRALRLAGLNNGDFNYSGGAGDADDFMIIDRAFLAQRAPGGVALGTAPTMPALFGSEDVVSEGAEGDADELEVWDLA